MKLLFTKSSTPNCPTPLAHLLVAQVYRDTKASKRANPNHPRQEH
jgi:hypothetical protein